MSAKPNGYSAERRREYQRARYNDNRTPERLTADRERRRLHVKATREREEAHFDPEDYAEEFEFATVFLQMSAREFIRGSAPRAGWFADNVLGRLAYARCGVCSRDFVPEGLSAFFPECSPGCRHDFLTGAFQ